MEKKICKRCKRESITIVKGFCQNCYSINLKYKGNPPESGFVIKKRMEQKEQDND